MSYLPTIGLEIHVELGTKTKMFCGCKNDSEEKRPNWNVCPICLGHPGTLPVPNKEAVKSVIMLGCAVGGTIAKKSHFDRKSYFYPDLPKGYQISQYEAPLVEGGMLEGIRIRRVHLEEDTGRLLHADSTKGSYSLIDFNRAGVPLMELVTEPDFKNAEEALRFAKELQLILRYLGISRADMEKGEMRVEANISIRKEGEDHGTKVEVKNINSFRAVYESIRYELERQEELLRRGKRVAQETRGWNERARKTESQRSKESAHDYRYFPEPDLPPLDLSEWNLSVLKAHIPELPEAKRRRFIEEFGFSRADVESLVEDKAAADYFEAAASELKKFFSGTKYQILLNYFLTDLRGLMNERNTSIAELKIVPEHLAHLVALLERGNLSSRLAKDLLLKMFETGEDPETLMRASGARLITGEEELRTVIEEVVDKNQKAKEDYKKGKENALQFLVGQAMAKTKGQASPEVVRKLLMEKLAK